MPDMHNKTRSNLAVMGRLVGLVKPLAPVMAAAVLLGVAGFLCAIFITVLGAYALLDSVLPGMPVSLGTVCLLLPVLAIARGVLHYAEQGCNHFIAFKLLALIRDKVFGALRRLAPAKLEGRDRGDLIAVLTADIELLEVFYAHTISPICIAIIVSAIMAAFLAGYLNFYLHLMFKNVTLVQNAAAGEIFEQLSQIGPGDVLVGISFPRYSQMAIHAVEYARDRGADVVAITDGQMSPLYRMATVSLLVRSDMISFVDSMAAPLSLLNALIVAVGRQKNEEVSGTFSQLENVWSKYNIFGKTEDES